MPFEANAGVFSGIAPAGTQTIRVLVDGRRLDRVAIRRGHRRFSFGPTGLPPRDVTISVRFLRGGKLLAKRTVDPVFGLPKSAWKVAAPKRTDGFVQRALYGTRSAPGVTSAVWAAGLAPGSTAASWNAGADFTAASTLKLAILICTFAHDPSDPVTSGWFSTYQQMILDSSNDAADDVLDHLGGSTSGGAAIVDSCIARLGTTSTIMYGGYEMDAFVPPVADNDPPEIAYGKHTSAHDLGMLLLALMQAASGKGPAHTLGLTERKARVALWLLIHARYPGLVRPSASAPVAHKAGWLDEVEHDASLVFTPHGTIILVVMNEAEGGVSYTSSAAYGGRVLRLVEKRLLPK